MSIRGIHLTGREQEVATALAVLRSPRCAGLLVHAPKGRGKTSFAQSLLAAVPSPAQWVQADRVLARSPYGALAPLLGVQDPPRTGADPAELRHAVARALTAPRPERAVVVVDDADELDVQSSAVLAQLAMSGRIRLLVLSRRHPSTSPQFGSLVHDGVLIALELLPLPDGEIRTLLRERLGGTVPEALDELFVDLCDGNPRVLEAWLDAARDQGVVVNRNGVWLLTGRFLEYSPVLRDIGHYFTAGVRGATRTLADLIALNGALAVQDALSLGLGDEVDNLVRSRLCTVTEECIPQVQFASHATAELHRATVSHGRSMVLRTGIGSGIDPSRRGLEQRMDWIRWSVGCGIELPRAVLIRTAREAMRSGRPLFAHAVLRSIGAEHLEPQQQVDLATALCDVNRALLASDLILQALPHITSPSQLDRSALVWARILLRIDTPSEELPAAVETWRSLAGGTCPTTELGAHRDELAEHLIRVLLPPGGSLTALDRHEQTAWPPVNRVAQALALISLSGYHAHRGHGAQARDLADRAIADDGTCENATDLLRLLHRSHPAFSTSLPSSSIRPPAMSTVDAAHLAQETGPAAFERGHEALGRGDFASASRNLHIAVEALTLWDDRQLLPLALATAAFATAQVPDPQATDALLRRLEELELRGTPEMLLLTRATATAARRLRGHEGGGSESLQQYARQVRATCSLSVEAQIHLLALSSGDTTTVTNMPPAQSLSARVTDHRVLLAARIGTAMRAGDGAELTRIASGIDGSPALVRTLAEQARRQAQDSGASVELANASELLRATGSPTRTMLSQRERQVAEGILEGLSNAEIAERLGLTTRTVEGHVYRLFRRLGIGRRYELTRRHLNLPASDPTASPSSSA